MSENYYQKSTDEQIAAMSKFLDSNKPYVSEKTGKAYSVKPEEPTKPVDPIVEAAKKMNQLFEGK